MIRYGLYVDGFNFYYQYIKKNDAYKWLNFEALFKNLDLKKGQIQFIRYFTAKVIPSKKYPNESTKQEVFLRALKTVPNMDIHFGVFRVRNVKGKLKNPNDPLTGKTVEISKHEEKGSDVNLASYLLLDCFKDKCDVPLIITNDSDLSTPIKIVRTELKKRIGLVSPEGPHVPHDLKKYASFKKVVSKSHFEKSLFPEKIKDSEGEFHCPKGWSFS